MEGGQKQKIDLESGLDVKSSDQLVPAARPLFQHNRQKFQGSMLPTSLRYEHNGWACGWDVYEFEVDVTAVETNPAGYTVIRTRLNDNPTYIFHVRSGTTTLVQIWHNAEDADKTGGLSISHGADDYSIVTLSGDNNGHAFEIVIDMITGEISYDRDEWLVAEDSYLDATASSGITTLNAVDLLSWVQFNAAIVEAEDVSYNGTIIAEYYSCSDGVHVWRDTSGGWEVEYDAASGECLVNGEAVSLLNEPDNDGGMLSVEYDTDYEGSISVALSGENRHFQVFDLSVSQSTTYVSTDAVGHAVDKWSLLSLGNSYLYPSSTGLNRMFLLATVPYWAGLKLSVYRSSDRQALSYQQVGFSVEDSIQEYVSADSRVYYAIGYYVSGESVTLYDSESSQGASASFWLGANECLSSYGVLDSEFGDAANVQGKLTYCTCVFNRFSRIDDEQSLPPLASLSSTESIYEKIENAPWFAGGTGLATKGGGTSDFQAGFYAPVEEGEDGNWYISIEGASIPTAYSPEQVVATTELDGYVRVEEPLAFYNQEVELESWSGSRYGSSTDEPSEAGPESVDIACLLNGTYLNESDGSTYSWGHDGYIVPYFYSVDDGNSVSSETRELENVEVTNSGSATVADAVVTFNSGPLAGFKVYLETTSDVRTVFFTPSSSGASSSLFFLLSESELTDVVDASISYPDDVNFRNNLDKLVLTTFLGLNLYACVSVDYGRSIISTNTGYSISTLKSRFSSISSTTWDKLESLIISKFSDEYPISEYGYTVYLSCSRVYSITNSTETQTYGYRYNLRYCTVQVAQIEASAYLYYNSSSITSLSEDGEEDVLSGMTSYAAIAPRYAYMKAEGMGSVSSSHVVGDINVYLSLCYDGLMQSTVRLLETDTGMFTSSNVASILDVSVSDRDDLLYSKGFYIDRVVNDTSDLSLFGVSEMAFNISIVSCNDTSFSASCFIGPVSDSTGNYNSVYLWHAQGTEDVCMIPGQVYNGDIDYINRGYNIECSLAGTSYSSSSLLFSLKGSTSPVFVATGIAVSWDSGTGSHAFYSDTLPSATESLVAGNIWLSSVGHTGNGNSMATEGIYLNFGGVSFNVLATLTLSGGSSSVSLFLEGVPVSIRFNGYVFTFGLLSHSWSSLNGNIALGVSVPLKYSLMARLPYQYNYASSFSYDGSTGEYLIDGDGYDAVPVGSYAVGYSSSNQRYSFQTTGDSPQGYTYSASTKELAYGTESYDTEAVGDARKAEIEAFEALELSFILQGPYKVSSDVEIVSFTDSSITFSYNGSEYTFDFSALMADEARNSLAFMRTDIRDDSAVPQSVTFAVQDTSAEYQFLRQQWNTLVEVENYWWIDSDTILELNKESLVVKRKVSSFSDYDDEADVDVDDWGGDAWKVACSFDRGDYIDNTVARYGVTCAYGGAVPRFWTVKLASSTSIQITFYTLSGSDYSWGFSSFSVTVPVNVVSIGSELNASSGRLNTYSQLSAETVIYEAKYSATVIGQHILFGIHLDNNFNQWALDISTSGSLNQVVQGYGYVGLDGCLTGGEIPSACFDSSVGFSGTVLPIDEIEQEDIEYVESLSEFIALDADGKVIGDESQQWYVFNSLSGIVSHLTWNGVSWDAVALPLSNTYSCVYGSPSYGKRVISDFSFWGQSLQSLLSDDSFVSAISDVSDLLYTKVYGYSPKITTALYLQQTMGQYAYVHYNSSMPGKQKDLTRENDSENVFEQSGEEGYRGTTYTAIGVAQRQKPEPIEAITAELADDFSFNLHGLRQSVTVEKPWQGSFGIALIIMNGMSSVMTTISDTLSVNLRNNQVSASDFGRRFSQVFLNNMDNLATLDKTIIGTIPTLQSAVGTTCTLDMFYSTCEGQKVSAGPGWVQHNLVAQCVAQSVTSCQWEMQQIGMLWIVEGLSSIGAKVFYYAAEASWDLVKQEALATEQAWTTAVGSGSNYGWIAAMVALGIGGAVYIAAMIYKNLAEITDMIVKSICGGTARVDVQNTSSKHTYDVEGKHKYGQKSQVFMWPCFGVESANTYTDETVSGALTSHEWKLHVPLTSGQSFTGGTSSSLGTIVLEGVLGAERQDDDVTSSFNGDILYQIANAQGTTLERTLPSDMAAITGSDSFLPPVPFRNENISESEPVFPTPCFQDYIIDKDWELSRTASDSMTVWISCKDTKLIDGDMSNAVVSDDFCGIACPYVAIEVKRGCEQKYIRPWAITPNALALNQTGYNCCYEGKAYHAFDGYGQRYVKWCGAPGMSKEGRVWHYAFIVNDRFKRSNKLPVQEFSGNFRGDPIIAMRTTGEDWVYNHVTDLTYGKGYEVGAIGEDKDSPRYAAPVFAEFVNSLPATLKTTSSFALTVIDGITSLTSNVTDKQHAYKAPVSVDFAINKSLYRFTNEYINGLEVHPRNGVTTVVEAVPTLGLSFLGSTPSDAYLYSEATRQYYTFSGGSSLRAVDTLERFRNVESGVYDFVQQEVVMPCVATFTRLDKHVFDDEDERDNRMVPRLRDGMFAGEVWPPIETIYNNRSGFKTISLPSGLCYQGPNRCIINRFVYSDHMKEQIIENYGKWKRVPREMYHPFRDYGAEYERVDETVASTLVGWTHNPFLLVTSPLGIDSETDCIFEWEVTFAWPREMDELYGDKQYAVVNLWGECFAPGGKAIPDRPVHVFLWRDLFTRTGNYGYYSFRYQSRCGAGNRERLHIWSDQYIAVSGLQVELKAVTQKRTEILTQAVDVQDMEEV